MMTRSVLGKKSECSACYIGNLLELRHLTMLLTHVITKFNLNDELFQFTLTKCKLDDIQEIKINFG